MQGGLKHDEIGLVHPRVSFTSPKSLVPNILIHYLLPYYLLPCYLLPYYPTILLPYYTSTLLPYYLLPYYPTTYLLYYYVLYYYLLYYYLLYYYLLYYYLVRSDQGVQHMLKLPASVFLAQRCTAGRLVLKWRGLRQMNEYHWHSVKLAKQLPRDYFFFSLGPCCFSTCSLFSGQKV